jgi:hypothetical protein
MVSVLSTMDKMLTCESDLWAAGQVTSGAQVQFAGRARCARRPDGRDPLKIVVKRALVAACGLEGRVTDRIGFPDFYMARPFVHDHLDADVCHQSRRVVAPAAADVDPVLVEARERDKSHIDALSLRTAVPFKTAAEIRQHCLLDRGVVGTGSAACYGGEHNGGEEVSRFYAFGADVPCDEHGVQQMTTEYGNCCGSAVTPKLIS